VVSSPPTTEENGVLGREIESSHWYIALKIIATYCKTQSVFGKKGMKHKIGKKQRYLW
jgi:hypothetical protein